MIILKMVMLRKKKLKSYTRDAGNKVLVLRRQIC